jgi:hypothetical protein
MRYQIEKSDTYTFHDGGMGVYPSRIYHVASSDKAGFSPPVLFNLKYHGQGSPLVIGAGFVIWGVELKAV